MAESSGLMWYELALTNLEVRVMFEHMVHGWFADCDSGYNEFVRALLADDTKALNIYMNRVALNTFSFFRQREGTVSRDRTGAFLSWICSGADGGSERAICNYF